MRVKHLHLYDDVVGKLTSGPAPCTATELPLSSPRGGPASLPYPGFGLFRDQNNHPSYGNGSGVKGHTSEERNQKKKGQGTIKKTKANMTDQNVLSP